MALEETAAEAVDATGVIDRTGETEALTQAFQVLTTPGAPTIVVLYGEPGMGTTTLAQLWAQRTRHHFPGGQLVIDGGAYTTHDGMALSDAVADCLLDLGVPGDEIPHAFSDRAQLFWHVLAERPPTLVLFDDAVDPAQVRTFAPRDGHGKILATSRDSMSELQIDGAHLVNLPPLPEATAMALLRHLCGPDRVDHEPAAAARLAELCGGRPLDLRVAAAHLASRTSLPIGDYLGEVDPNVEVCVVEHAYRRLTPEAGAFYERLGAVRGLVSFTAQTAAIIARTDLRGARQLLSHLTAAAVLVQKSGRRHWAFPRLVGSHANQRAKRRSPQLVAEVVTDLTDHYLVMTCIAGHALTGRPIPGDVAVPQGLGDAFVGLDRTSRAVGWLTAERANILAVLYAASRYDSRQSWQLAEAVTEVLLHRGHLLDALDAIDYGIYAAYGHRNCPEAAAAHLRLRLARAWIRLDFGRPDIAQEDFDVAVDLADSAGDTSLSASLAELRARLA